MPVTPSPLPGEGVRGYILRVSEENGYPSPYAFLQYAGVSFSQMNQLNIPIEPLARVLGISGEQLISLRWQDHLKESHEEAGTPKWLRRCLQNSTKLCPLCVAEHGRLDAAWEHRLMLGCPTHRIWLTSRCRTCQRELSWFRPGLLRCKCGSTIVPQEEAISDDLTALFSLLHDLFHRIPATPIPDCGFPESELRALRAAGFLTLLTRFGNILENKLGRTLPPTELVQDLATIFKDWPAGFHGFMQRIQKSRPEGGYRAFSMEYQFRLLHATIFKHTHPALPPENLAFLREAYVQFGASKWSGVLPNPRLLAKTNLEEGELNVTGVTELARRIGIRLRTAKRWVDNAVFPSRQILFGTKMRTIIEVPSDLPKKVVGRGLNIREAARDLQLPVSVIAELRRLGAYKVHHICNRTASFHSSDVDQFRSDLLAMAPWRLDAITRSEISLGDLLKRKFGTGQTKAKIVKAFIDGEIAALGRTADQLPNIVFDRRLMEQFVLAKVKAKQTTAPAHTAAKYLGCDSSVIKTLFDRGLIEGKIVGREMRITLKSLAKFSNEYVTCCSIAELKATTVCRVMNICKRLSIPLMLVPRKNKEGNQPFFRREHLQILGVSAEKLQPFNPSPAVEDRQASGSAPRVAVPVFIYRKIVPMTPGRVTPTTPLAQRLTLIGACSHRNDRTIDFQEATIRPKKLPSSTIASAVIPQQDVSSQLELPVDPFERKKRISVDERLSAYLELLKDEGRVLPCRDGKPNIRAIAAACGIGRNVLYAKPKALAMIDRYFDEETIRLPVSRSRTPLEVVRTYIEGLREQGKPLPVHKVGQVNLQATAKACGINRQRLYRNPEILLLLSDYASAASQS